MDNKYYLGLDIGTDSVGYAVTDEYYQLKKFRGEPVWGVTTFEAASLSQERRAFRTARRRIDRKQQRVELVNEIFSREIEKVDPRFFIRRAESRLFREETEDEYIFFNDPKYKDADYHRQYPTVHHLLYELMTDCRPHDVRLVYLACSWLVAHRGHFLFDISADNVSELLDFSIVYNRFRNFFADNGIAMPWSEDISPDVILNIMKQKTGVSKKKDMFKNDVFGGKKEKQDAEYPYKLDALKTLLSGGKVKLADLFQNEEYEDIESVTLKMPDEDFARIVAEIGDDGELLIKLRELQDCAMLIGTQNGKRTISEAKIEVYEQHKKDLKNLKAFVKKYIPAEYNAIFRDASEENYVAYSANAKSCKDGKLPKGKADAEKFGAFLAKKLKGIKVEKNDEAFYNDMMERISSGAFLPKQTTTDNRVIPQQLYRYELQEILKNAENYLPFLLKKDSEGLTNEQKILSIFDFRIPYFVGPLNSHSNNAWIVRKAEGRIYPWNFADMVDFDKCESAFIDRMTNNCTYLPGETVLPEKSLLYSRYKVLNEINNLKINGISVPVSVKQGIFNDVYLKNPRVSVSSIKNYLKANNFMSPEDELSGIDIKINNTLSTYHQFRRLLEAKVITEEDAERIIERAAYSEDKTRFITWLESNYPRIKPEDRKYIARLNLKGFGRLSRELLDGILGADAKTGEAGTMIDYMWNTNNNLMQLLSERYTFRKTIEELTREYYAGHPQTLSKRLDEMYVSNAVKRPIIRTLDICGDVVKAMGKAPDKIFIEMARGATEDQKGKRTQTRKQQLLELYKKIKSEDARELEKELEDMGAMADNRLQGDKLFLYFLQMGKCAYTGQPIELSRLAEGIYNIDHIYPQAFVKDDSILDNKVLVLSEVNGAKTNVFPISGSIQKKMRPVWQTWLNNGLITEEKFRRLVRTTGFTEEEKLNFINRQLVETRQSTKAVAQILNERYPDSEIVYVKAGLVSDFRHDFDMLKCRSVNNLHHAKDAYLNIVVGNVYNSKFTKNFNVKQDYSIKVEKIFSNPVKCGNTVVWQGGHDIAKVRSVMSKNAVHVTRYAFCRKGGLFDQQPVKAAEGLVPLKKGLPSEKYGGYNKATASFFSLVRFSTDKKTDVMFMPVELIYADRYLQDAEYAKQYAAETIGEIFGNKVNEVEILLGGRPIKINTVICADGLRMVISGKSSGGKEVITQLQTQLVISPEFEKYIKAIDTFKEKRKNNASLVLDSKYDKIDKDTNLKIYDVFLSKMSNTQFSKAPNDQYQTLLVGRNKFINLSITEQAECLSSILVLFSSVASGVDITPIGGSKRSGARKTSSSLSGWKKKYKDVRIIDMSASGLFESRSENLLDLV